MLIHHFRNLANNYTGQRRWKTINMESALLLCEEENA